jgi:hypothetical protein
MMMQDWRQPNFFIVGAPKCGTTAMNHYLRQRPQIFMPHRKDITYFGSDLKFSRPRISHEQYLSLFQDANGAARIGETSVWYLYSKKAAQEIKSFAPSARIIVMLRNPVDMLYAQHSQFLYNCNEDIVNFEEALAAEVERKQGKRIPPQSHFVAGLFYRETIMYTEQLARYFETFGRQNIHVILFDDFIRDTGKSFAETLAFLAVEDSFQPAFPIVNSNKVLRSRRLQEFLVAPPPLLVQLFHWITPARLRGRIFMRLRKLNMRKQDRPALDPLVRKRLQAEFDPEVERLGKLLGCDLSSWSRS